MPLHLGDAKQRIESFCRRWSVRELSLFGSALRDDFTPESDVDVLVEIEPSRKLTAWDWVDMIEEIRSIFGREVDLVEKDAVRNPFRRKRIMATARMIYAE